MKIKTAIGPRYKSKKIKHIKSRFEMLKVLAEKFAVDETKPRDIKSLVHYLKLFLYYLHMMVFREHFKRKKSTYTKEYLKELLENIVDIMNHSTSWHESMWDSVDFTIIADDVPDLDELARFLISKISRIIALQRFQK